MQAAVSVRGLYKAFRESQFLGRLKPPVPALEGIDFELFPGEMVALVGESGSGKTTLGRCILGLLPFEKGTVMVNGFNIGELSGSNEKEFRMSAQMVFQNPYASLNPAFKAHDALVEAVRTHNPTITKKGAYAEAKLRVLSIHPNGCRRECGVDEPRGSGCFPPFKAMMQPL